MASSATAEEVREAYKESLGMLTLNSRPVIMNLTELANEYKKGHANLIVGLIEHRMKEVRIDSRSTLEETSLSPVRLCLQAEADSKLPCLYLLDSVMKNHPDPYKDIIERNIVNSFAHVFAAAPSIKTRAALYKLRTTWGEVFAADTLHRLDLKIKSTLDPKWPVTSSSASAPPSGQNIHINPAVFNRNRVRGSGGADAPSLSKSKGLSQSSSSEEEGEEARIARELKERKLELMRLEKQKLDLEVARAKRALEQVTTYSRFFLLLFSLYTCDPSSSISFSFPFYPTILL